MDAYTRSLRNGFADLALDRAAHRRLDDAWIEQARAAATSRYLVMAGERTLLAPGAPARPLLLPPGHAGVIAACAGDVIFLGEDAHGALFVLAVDEVAELELRLGADLCVSDLREAARLLPAQDAALAAYARAMVLWHRRERCCGRCGRPTVAGAGGHLRSCSDPACGTVIYPRTDPAIIVLVTCGDRCLLGRAPHWPARMYSTLAGFVEPGETLEHAVRREVFEESGIHLGQLQYRSSQPWPFPGALMIGFEAQATTETLRRDETELEDVIWMTRLALAESVRATELRLPPNFSIAFRLIEDWFDREADTPLACLAPD